MLRIVDRNSFSPYVAFRRPFVVILQVTMIIKYHVKVSWLHQLLLINEVFNCLGGTKRLTKRVWQRY